MAPSVSIVVPVFGTEASMARCLRSLRRQTFGDIDVIVVDDGSPGDPASIVADVAGSDARFRVLRHAHNLGVMHARLTGARGAAAPYLAFVDPDDEVEDWYVEVLHAAATRHNADLVQCAITIFDPDARVINRGGETHQLNNGDILRGLLGGEMSNSLCNKLIRTSTWHAATEPLSKIDTPVPFGQDLLCLFHVAMHSVRYAHVPEAGYRYMPQDENTTATGEIDRLVRNLVSLNEVHRMIGAELMKRSEPTSLVQQFFDREFRVVSGEMLHRISRRLGLDTADPTIDDE